MEVYNLYCLSVKKVKKFNNIAIIEFDREIRGYPGQFIMLNVFGFEEIPLSLSSPKTITVKNVGKTTNRVVNTKEGDVFGIRGPFGRPFSYPDVEKIYLIAGGIGIAPLNYLYEYFKDEIEVIAIHGVKTKEELIYDYPEVATEDGSVGFRGNAVELFLKLADFKEEFRVYSCGPKPMLLSLYKIMKKLGKLESLEVSLENYMRCGIGLCGSCVTESGARVCRDGPTFKGTDVSEKDFI